MMSERDTRILLVEKCKYLMSKLPAGEFEIDEMGTTIIVIDRFSAWNNRPLREILINMEPLDNHVLLSSFTTPELIDLEITLSRYYQYNSFV
ncbi:MAG TPA: hypothetical protein VFG45_00610 [Candidatus Nitrosocosmicus sp.]|nr:hypothetical protein [Candidatus Nitrosocosmicus sp.]